MSSSHFLRHLDWVGFNRPKSPKSKSTPKSVHIKVTLKSTNGNGWNDENITNVLVSFSQTHKFHILPPQRHLQTFTSAGKKPRCNIIKYLLWAQILPLHRSNCNLSPLGKATKLKHLIHVHKKICIINWVSVNRNPSIWIQRESLLTTNGVNFSSRIQPYRDSVGVMKCNQGAFHRVLTFKFSLITSQ